jgi:hypothetical protein
MMRTLSALLLATLIPLSPLWADFEQKDIDDLYNAWLEHAYDNSLPRARAAHAHYYGRSAAAAAAAAPAVSKFDSFKAKQEQAMHPAYRVVGILRNDIRNKSYGYAHDPAYVADANKAIAAILTRGEYFGGFSTTRTANKDEMEAAYFAVHTLGGLDRNNTLGKDLAAQKSRSLTPAVRGHLNSVEALYNTSIALRRFLDRQISPQFYVYSLKDNYGNWDTKRFTSLTADLGDSYAWIRSVEFAWLEDSHRVGTHVDELIGLLLCGDLQEIADYGQRPKDVIHKRLQALSDANPDLTITPMVVDEDNELKPSGDAMELSILVETLQMDGIPPETLQEYIDGIRTPALVDLQYLLEEEKKRLELEQAANLIAFKNLAASFKVPSDYYGDSYREGLTLEHFNDLAAAAQAAAPGALDAHISALRVAIETENSDDPILNEIDYSPLRTLITELNALAREVIGNLPAQHVWEFGAALEKSAALHLERIKGIADYNEKAAALSAFVNPLLNKYFGKRVLPGEGPLTLENYEIKLPWPLVPSVRIEINQLLLRAMQAPAPAAVAPALHPWVVSDAEAAARRAAAAAATAGGNWLTPGISNEPSGAYPAARGGAGAPLPPSSGGYPSARKR